VNRCNQSRRTRQVITISGLDHLTGRLASSTGIVESVQIDQSATKEKRFLVTMTSELQRTARPYPVGATGGAALSRLARAVTSCAGANGFSRRMLLGTPCDAHLSAAAPVM
jgi:hypothetical protein